MYPEHINRQCKCSFWVARSQLRRYIDGLAILCRFRVVSILLGFRPGWVGIYAPVLQVCEPLRHRCQKDNEKSNSRFMFKTVLDEVVADAYRTLKVDFQELPKSCTRIFIVRAASTWFLVEILMLLKETVPLSCV